MVEITEPEPQGRIPSTSQALEEALELSEDILADIELGRVALSAAALKASRLARLLNDFDAQEMFKFEAGGYPSPPSGITPQVWRLAQLAGRVFFRQSTRESSEVTPYAYIEPIEKLEEEIATGKLALAVAGDRDVSLSSANPYQQVQTPPGNLYERTTLRQQITTAAERLASRRTLIFDYASRQYYELKFSGLAQDLFSRIRATVDGKIAGLVPEAVQKFTAVHDNLRTENPEDWANAVHTCRRILQDLADAIFPPNDEPRVVRPGANERTINLGPDNYINRLVCYAEDHSSSSRFQELVGSHLGYLGDRLDAVFQAAQKGSHASVSREEANRYVVYTYMIVGDLLGLATEEQGDSAATLDSSH